MNTATVVAALAFVIVFLTVATLLLRRRDEKTDAGLLVWLDYHGDIPIATLHESHSPDKLAALRRWLDAAALQVLQAGRSDAIGVKRDS